MLRRPRISTLFPYTTLFRSEVSDVVVKGVLKHAGFLSDSGHLREVLLGEPGGLGVLGGDRKSTSELQSPYDLVCRLLLEKKNNKRDHSTQKHDCRVSNMKGM